MGKRPVDVATAPEVKDALAAAKPTKAPASASTMSFAAESEEADVPAAPPEQKAATVGPMPSRDAEAAADGGATSGKRQADEAPEADAQPPSKAPKSAEDEA